jgi:DEAD/DEAH box helicase domain-containing protein
MLAKFSAEAGVGIEQLIAHLRIDAGFRANVAHWHVDEARAAERVPPPPGLDAGIRGALAARGIDGLYSHQAAAVEHALRGRHAVVVTPTASGKTLCYNLPVLQTMRSNPGARALYLFPTKALSQDQVAELSDMVRALGSDYKTYTYDGDTPADARRLLREDGHVIVTNPYMLHAGILPNHPKWTNLFQNLTYVVIDELHTYRGVFGSHVANVLRRLRRVCRHYGANPTFIAASATIGNPRELAERLVEAPFELVERSGAPRGERHFAFYNPPIVHRELGLRAAAVEEVRRLARRFLPYGVQMVVFGRSRNQVEVLLKYMKDAAAETGVDPRTVRGYRGGYLPKLRREIERGLRAGDVRVVVATNALELGVDIGSLDVAILTGYPGSAASFFQQAGRAGRRERPSLAVMVGRSVPIDQYILRHPEYVLERPREATVIDPENLLIKVNHVKCSAFEVPFREAEEFGGPREPARRHEAPEVAALEGAPRESETRQLLDYLALDAKILHRAQGSYYWMAEAYPADGVSLTAADIDNFVIYDVAERRIMAEVDRPSAMTEIHEGAIYGFEGEQYVIERLDYENRRAYARKVSCDYYTEAECERKIRALEVDEEARHPAYEARRGDVEVTTKATVFKKIKFYTRENIGAGEIHLPPEVVDTTCAWFTVDAAVAAELGLFGAGAGALLALRNLVKNVLPLFIRCDPRDVHVWSEVRAPAWGDRPTIYVFDHMPAGVGLAERAFGAHREIFAAMAAVLGECVCERGCPACCGTEMEIGAEGKGIARALLARLLGGRGGAPAAALEAAAAAAGAP